MSQDDVDVDDLEDRLYSRIYHKDNEESQSFDNSTQGMENSNIPDNHNGVRQCKMSSFANQLLLGTNNISNSASSFVPSMDANNENPRLLSEPPSTNNPREVPSSIPQVINMVNPFNNIVVLPEAAPHFLSANAIQPYINKNLEKFLKRQNVRMKRSMRRKIQRKRRRNLKINDVLIPPKIDKTIFGMGPSTDQNLESNKPFNAEEPSDIPTEIIEASDSNDSCCIVIKDENSLIVLSSDESVDLNIESVTVKSKKKLKKPENSCNNLIELKSCDTDIEKLNQIDDDVIFVEPKPVEIIEIDIDQPQTVVNLDTKSVADADASKQEPADKLTETSSSNSMNKARTKRGMTSKERRELLNTPDSTTSNDFLVNPVEAPHTRFNFDLHDSDFSNSQIFLKPKSQADAYETESSCSTSDISSTPIKTTLFNEVEFEAPVKQFFDDTNLEGFGNYITPNRSIPSILTADFEQVKTKVTKRGLQVDSDSSSENERDGSKASYLDAKKTNQILPNLCPIELSDIPKGRVSKTKKKKLSNSVNDDKPTKQAGNKRKSSFEGSDENKNEAQKKTKNKSDQEYCKNNENQSDGVSDGVSVKKSNQNESKRNRNRKDFSDGDHTKEIVEKNATVEETNVMNKSDEIKNVLVEDHPELNDQAITVISDTDESDVPENKPESSGIKKRVVDNTFEDIITSNFIILDETADEKDSSDGFSNASFQGDFSDFQELTDDLTLANCESISQHPKQSDVSKKRKRFSDYWNADSQKFHNSSWGLENFSIEETQKSMSDDPDLWKIVDRDRVFVRLNVPKRQRCRRCREVGHTVHRCRNAPITPKCTLCGTKGHIEPRCPNAMCTTCGNTGNYSTYCSQCVYWKNTQCNICKVFGHFDWVCPDLWRRYHLTTKPGPIVVPEMSRGKLFQNKWCCNCANFGHYEQNCRYANRAHFLTVSEIKEYVDIYNFPKSQPTITLSESTRENDQTTESSIQQENDERREEANSSIQETNNKIQVQKLSEKSPRDVFVLDKTDDNSQSKVTYPPEHMIPSYFQQQLSYLKYGGTSTSENARNESATITTALISDSSLNLGQEVINKLSSGELCSKRIILLAHKFAYLHSNKGKEFIDKIRAKNSVNVIVKRSRPDAAEVGVIILYGNEKEVQVISEEFNTFLYGVFSINIRIIPKDSDLLYTFLSKAFKQLRCAQGNSKDIFDSILVKKQKFFASGNTDWKNKAGILMRYHRLNTLLFGRCKLQDGGKHLTMLESWLKTTKNKHFVVTLKDRFDIYEAYMYIYKLLRSDDEYASLCKNANYHVDMEKLIAADGGMSRKQRMHFKKKIKEIIRTCRRYNFEAELLQATNVQMAVIKSEYSKTAYDDFLRYVNYFVKYFCNFRNSKS